MAKPLSQEYAITITLAPKLRRLNTEDQEEIFRESIIETLNQSSAKASLVFELTQNMDIHAHGFIKVPIHPTRPAKQIICNMFRRKTATGFICVKVVEDYQTWYSYCIKDMKETYENGITPIQIDDLKIFLLENPIYYLL